MEMNLKLLLLFISLISFRTDALSIYKNAEQNNDDTNIISADGTDKDVMWLYEELDENGNTDLNGQNICKYFDIFSNQLKIDCGSLKFVLKPRAIAQTGHVIRKRDIEDNPDTFDGGSGDGELSTSESVSHSSEPSFAESPESSPPPVQSPAESTVNPESTVNLENTSESQTEISSTELSTVKSEENKKARKFNPNISTKPEVPKDVEELNDHQNNNSVTVHPELVEDEKKINSMKKSETGNVEESNPGESAESPARASKDTKILIVLFVAVVIIGVGAFLYNFIKKKRQTASITNENNDANKNEDPERGQEMKPLMKGKIENGEKQDNGKTEVDIEKNENDKVTV